MTIKLSTNSALPLYKQLMQHIKNEIEQENLTPGSKLMNETDLEKAYGVSRITVRKALKELTEEGILERKQGKGTFVRKIKMTRELIAVDGFSDFIKQIGKHPSSRILSCMNVHATEKQAKKLMISEGDELLRLERILFIDNEPMAVDVSHYPLEEFPNLHQYVYEYSSTYEVLHKIYNVKFGVSNKIISVELADIQNANLLNCDVGTPLFNFSKTLYNTDNQAVHISD